MIKYQLLCENNHQFEEWFESISGCDTMLREEKVHCPICQSSKVKKAIMTPAIGSSNTKPAVPCCGGAGLCGSNCPFA